MSYSKCRLFWWELFCIAFSALLVFTGIVGQLPIETVLLATVFFGCVMMVASLFSDEPCLSAASYTILATGYFFAITVELAEIFFWPIILIVFIIFSYIASKKTRLGFIKTTGSLLAESGLIWFLLSLY